ncbi:MAG: inositol monophosphatase family protein [Mariprofundaceae bacterium]
MPDYRKTLAAIVPIIEAAGKNIIMPAFREKIVAASKSDGSVVTDTDIACQRFIERGLADLEAGIPFLGEEMYESDQIQRLNEKAGRYWCLDPLDGTTNFVAGIPVFGTSLALVDHGHPVLACIHDPVRGETFTAIRSHGACLNAAPIRGATETELASAVGFIDFKRLGSSHKQAMLGKGLYRSQRNIGTCALEWAWLAAGRGHFILHGGEKLWDFAAGSLIALESGCVAGNFSSSPLFPCQSLSSPILACCTEDIRQQLINSLAD